MTKDLSTLNTQTMEDNTKTTTGEIEAGSPGSKPAVRGNIEDIWNETVGSPTKNPDRRRNGTPPSLSFILLVFLFLCFVLSYLSPLIWDIY
jgi:hypothetical protein